MPRRPRSADDPPKRTPSFVCEVPLRVSPPQERALLARLEAARQVYNACLGQARRRVRLVRESKAFQHARTLPRDDPARKERFREARAQHGFSEYALHAYAQQFGHSWLGAHLDSLTIQTLATSGLPRRQSAARGEGPPGPVQGPAPAGHGRGQDQYERPPLVRDRRRVEGTGAAGAPRSARPGAGPRTRLPGQVRAPGPPQARASGIASTPSWCARGRRTRSRTTTWAAGSSGWIWDPRPSRWSPSRQRSSSRSVPRWLPTHRALRRLDRQLDRQRRANNPANYDERGRVKRGPKRWKVSKRQRQGAGPAARAPPQAGGHAQAQSRAARPSGAGDGERLSPGAALLSGVAEDLREVGPALRAGHVCRAIVSSGCECWRDRRLDQRLACAALPNVPLWPQSRRKPAPSAGRCARVAPAPSAISSRPIWPASLTQRRPCSTWVRRTVPGRGGSPPVPPAYEQAIQNQPARGRRLPAAFGRPPADPSQSGSLAEGLRSRA